MSYKLPEPIRLHNLENAAASDGAREGRGGAAADGGRQCVATSGGAREGRGGAAAGGGR